MLLLDAADEWETTIQMTKRTIQYPKSMLSVDGNFHIHFL